MIFNVKLEYDYDVIFTSQVIHQFSHIHYHCHCWHVKKRAHSLRGNPLAIENAKWVERNLLTQQPISALVKKVRASHDC